MMKTSSTALLDRDYFETLRAKTLALLKPQEHIFIGYAAEQSQFIRINAAKVRQIGTVEDGSLELTMIHEENPQTMRKSTASIRLRGLSYEDLAEITRAVEQLRAEVRKLPPDPYAVLPTNPGSSTTEKKSRLLDIEEAPRALLGAMEGVDIAGIYASGPIVRAMANSAGLAHWFSTSTFSLDFSLYTPAQKAVKSTYAGREWNAGEFASVIESSRAKLALMDKPSRKLERGTYRTYLEPAAVSDLAGMLSWRAIGEAAIRQGDSPLRKLRTGEAKLSPKFSMGEDFSAVETPRFNDEGELSPEKLPLIQNGALANTLVSTRSAKEYGVPANGAAAYESFRAPAIAAGELPESQAMSKLGEGLYLSNLHYLNWSDQPAGRITGMTRYACFWVEGGKIVAPIENLRFDDTIFSLFGDALVDLTRERKYLPEVHTYFMRQPGGSWAPGMLVSGMKFTL